MKTELKVGEVEINKIYLGDCLEGLKNLPDECIDLTVTSPPYDDLKQYEKKLWTYGHYSFNFEAIAKELYRVTRKGGVVVWVVCDETYKGSETGSSFMQCLYFRELGFNINDTMIFAKKNNVPSSHIGKRYEQRFEYMFVLSKGEPNTFNRISRTADKLSNIWTYNSSNRDSGSEDHPAPFPEELARDHIKAWTKEGDLVLDIFSGSGTTCQQAKFLKRNFLGFEISEKYFQISNRRLSQEPLFHDGDKKSKQGKLF